MIFQRKSLMADEHEKSDTEIYDSDVMDLDGELTSTDSEGHESSPAAATNGVKFESNGHLENDVDEVNIDETNVEESADSDSDVEMTDFVEPSASVEEVSEPSWKVLGEHRFVEKKIISSAPSWAENPTTFDAQIKSRTGKGIGYIDGLDQQLYEALSNEISVWFPVQQAVLPKLLKPNEDETLHDIAISAPTGSGKTLCYLIPIFNQILCGWRSSKYVMAVVLAPTRTLIHQIAREFSRFNTMDAKIVVFNDGSSYESERRELFSNESTKARAHVIISTPERLVQHLIDRNGTINLKRLRYLVVDEADAMRFVREEWLGMLERAANYSSTHDSNDSGSYNTHLQKVLVSATLSLQADKLHDWNLRSPCLYRATPKNVVQKNVTTEDEATSSMTSKNLPTSDVGRLTLPTGLTHEIKICQRQRKPLFIYVYLAKNPQWQKVMIFVNSIDTSRRLTLLLSHLFADERKIFEISSNLHVRRRMKLLKKLEEAENCVVICSDTVGRGIDIDDVDVIFNYDTPQDARTFVHRAGRAARAGKSGHAITLTTKEEKLGFKRNLISVDIWESAVENREKDADFVKRFSKKYENALNALKETIGGHTLRNKLQHKKNRWKKFK